MLKNATLTLVAQASCTAGGDAGCLIGASGIEPSWVNLAPPAHTNGRTRNWTNQTELLTFIPAFGAQLLRAGVNCFELSELGDDRAGRGSVGDEPRGLDLPAGPAQHLLLLLLLLRPPPPQQQLTFAVRLTSTPLLSSPPWNWDFYTGWLRHPCLWGAPGKPVKSIHVYWTSGILHFVQCTRLYKTEEDADPIQAQFCSIMKLFRTFSRHSPPCRHGRHPLQTQGHLLPSSK